MNVLVKTITVTLVSLAVVSTGHAKDKRTLSKTGATFGIAQHSGGGQTAYPSGEFPTPGAAAAACGGMGNVGSIQDTSDDGVQHPIRYYCAKL